MARIGIMGGTFNPIHMGHLMLAECAREEFDLDEVWFIPTGHSYMKAGDLSTGNSGQNTGSVCQPSPEERFHMTELATEGNPFFQCLDIEIRREGNTYTYETLEYLGRKYPDNEYFFIFGADCLYSIENWKYPDRIFAACRIIASVRGDADKDKMQEKIGELRDKYRAKIDFMPFRDLELSSTDIRKRVLEQKSIRYMTPDPVISYINTKGFYKDESDGDQKDQKSNGEKSGF